MSVSISGNYILIVKALEQNHNEIFIKKELYIYMKMAIKQILEGFIFGKKDE